MFDAQVAILDLLSHKSLVTAGYGCVLHIHAVIVECQIHRLLFDVNRKTGERVVGKRPRFFRSGDYGMVRIELEETIAIETFQDCPQLGRFTLRDEGKTIAIGKVIRIIEESQIKAAQAAQAAGGVPASSAPAEQD